MFGVPVPQTLWPRPACLQTTLDITQKPDVFLSCCLAAIYILQRSRTRHQTCAHGTQDVQVCQQAQMKSQYIKGFIPSLLTGSAGVSC
jgi:hypothetical protein